MLFRLSLLLLLLSGMAACAGSPPTAVGTPLPSTVATTAATPPAATAGTPVAAVATSPAPALPTAPPTATGPGEPVQVSPADSRLRYRGRFDFQDPQAPAFDWSGVAIEALFEGPAVSVLLDDSGNYYDVLLDGQASVLQTMPDQDTYLLGADLGPGPHTLRLTKRTEADVGAAVFRGLVLDGGGTLLEAPEGPRRSLEFIGDSITAGYGIEGTSPECYFTPATQNAALSYAAQTAYALDAGYTLVALSGLGVVRNLGAAEGAGGPTAVSYVGRTLGMNDLLQHSPGGPEPDAVIVNLGTNDFSSEPFPADEAFRDAYQELLSALRLRYPEAAIVAVAGPLMYGRAPALIREAVAGQQAAGDNNSHFVLLEDNLARSAEDFGCDWHPNVNGHRKMADQLAPALREILSW